MSFCLTSRSRIFQSFSDGATASWVFTSTLGTLKCLAQGHYTAVVGFEPWTSRSGVRSSTTEPPRPRDQQELMQLNNTFNQRHKSRRKQAIAHESYVGSTCGFNAPPCLNAEYSLIYTRNTECSLILALNTDYYFRQNCCLRDKINIVHCNFFSSFFRKS